MVTERKTNELRVLDTGSVQKLQQKVLREKVTETDKGLRQVEVFEIWKDIPVIVEKEDWIVNTDYCTD